MKKILIPLCIIVILLVGGAFYYIQGISSVSSKDEVVEVTIESGQSNSSILNTLDEAGLLKNKLCAKVFLKLNHFTTLKANTYLLNKNMDLNEIFTLMEKPKSEYVLSTKITIKEGQTIAETAEIIADKLQLKKDDVINKLNDTDYLNTLINQYWFLTDDILKEGIKYPLEGYLYPETYLLSHKNATVEDLVSQSLDMMDIKLSTIKDDIEKTDWTVHQFLTFSSIVERESLFDEDRAKIAGVFVNRLNTNMKLQSDITVNYAWNRTGVKVTTAHLAIDSPYNTDKYAGLPIGPISSVPLNTMNDCINYEHNDYLYFFAKEDGTVIYSKTLEEHNKAVKENKWY
jgi:UPF0755 protein